MKSQQPAKSRSVHARMAWAGAEAPAQVPDATRGWGTRGLQPSLEHLIFGQDGRKSTTC